MATPLPGQLPVLPMVNDSATVTFTADVLTPTGTANEYLNTAQVSASDQSGSGLDSR